MRYSVYITADANNDIASIVEYISESCCAPQAAVNLYNAIIGTIRSLEAYAGIYAPVDYKSLSKYGQKVYRISCKGFAIVYTIELSTVIVHRIVHGSLIT